MNVNTVFALEQSITLPSANVLELTGGLFIIAKNGQTPNLNFIPEGGTYNAEEGKITWNYFGQNRLRWNQDYYTGTITQSFRELTFLDIFPDENLAQAVAYNSCRNSEDTVTIQELNNFGGRYEALALQNLHITDLEGIQYFTNLNFLIMTNNRINNLEPLNTLNNLTLLDLRGSDINNIEFLKGLNNLALIIGFL